MEKVGAEVDLGKKLQQVRQSAGLTQQELCQKTGLSYSTLAKIERGAIKSPSIFTVQSIAEACGTSLSGLMGEVSGLVQKRPETLKKTSKSGVSFVYFDINGCLVRFFHRGFSKLAHDSGASPDLIETTFWHYNDAVCRGELSLKDFNIILGERIGYKDLNWKDYYMSSVDSIKEMHDCVSWAAQNYRVGLLSNIMPGFIDEMLRNGLLPNVDYQAIIDSSEIGAIKPEQQIYQTAQAVAGVDGSQILLVDDSRANLMAAEKSDWHVLWFDDYRPGESQAKVRQTLEF